MLLCPSLMCADFTRLGDELLELEAAGADVLHMDVMDGAFVPNFACGPEAFKAARKVSSLPMDAHLMVNDPDKHVALFAELGAGIIYIHPEADRHPAKTLAHIAALGAKPGIAINPGTSLAQVEELLPLCDYVLAMTVNPGFAGQSFLPFTLGKVGRLGVLAKTHGFTLCCDGALSPERIAELSELGVEGFVLGTSALFGKGRPYADIMRELRSNARK